MATPVTGEQPQQPEKWQDKPQPPKPPAAREAQLASQQQEERRADASQAGQVPGGPQESGRVDSWQDAARSHPVPELAAAMRGGDRIRLFKYLKTELANIGCNAGAHEEIARRLDTAIEYQEKQKQHVAESEKHPVPELAGEPGGVEVLKWFKGQLQGAGRDPRKIGELVRQLDVVMIHEANAVPVPRDHPAHLIQGRTADNPETPRTASYPGLKERGVAPKASGQLPASMPASGDPAAIVPPATQPPVETPEDRQAAEMMQRRPA